MHTSDTTLAAVTVITAHLATTCNGSIMALDGIAEISWRDAGKTAYMLADGVGKAAHATTTQSTVILGFFGEPGRLRTFDQLIKRKFSGRFASPFGTRAFPPDTV